MKSIPQDKIASCSLEQMRKHTHIPIEVVKDRESMAVLFARTVLDYVREANKMKKRVVIIMPIGPIGQWKQMIDTAVSEKINLSRLSIIQMDEYLTAGSMRIPMSDPCSFTGFVWKVFGKKAVRKCEFQKKNWIVPDPENIDAVDRAIKRWRGVDVAFAGIGLDGHIAFNEPPGASESWTDESFANSSTRIVKLTETTKAANSIFGTGGELGRVPDYAVTIGMKQILEAKRIHIFLNWHWQRFVMRRTLLGPISRSFPASFIQTHKDVRFTITEEVAAVHSLVPE